MSAIIFDRDGTLMEYREYPKHPKEVTLLPGAMELWKLRDTHKLFLHSNQSGVVRGLMTPTQVRAVQREFTRQLGGNPFEKTRLALEPPGEQPKVSYRKPSPRFIREIHEEFAIPLGDIIMVGDSECDITAARLAGARSILIRSKRTQDWSHPKSCRVVDSLEEAITLLK